MSEITWEEWSKSKRNNIRLMGHRWVKSPDGTYKAAGCVCFEVDFNSVILSGRQIHDQILAIKSGFAETPVV